MYLVEKINAVPSLYEELDREIQTFKSHSALSCPINCGSCCLKSDLEATVLEFLPAAYELYMTKKYEDVLERLENVADNTCVFYNPFEKNGLCNHYSGRGLICRLFGFSVQYNKHSQRTLIACKLLKSNVNPTKLNFSLKLAPEMNSWYMKLYGIDPLLSGDYMPVNKAIRKALEIVLLHGQYDRKKPA
jgi:Fe-S-cluster containining protein